MTSIRTLKTPVRLEYTIRAGRDASRFLGAVARGELIAKRCDGCSKVYLPPRGACPTCSLPMTEELAVPDTGTVTSFCIVRVPYEGQTIALPYVYAWVLIDGTDLPLPHLVQGIAANDVRMGLRVRAEWVAPELRGPTLESIRWFCPTGEPDAPYDSYKEHL